MIGLGVGLLALAVPALRLTQADAAIPIRAARRVIRVLGCKCVAALADALIRVDGVHLAMRAVVLTQGHRTQVAGVHAKRILTLVMNLVACRNLADEMGIRPSVRENHRRVAPWVEAWVAPSADIGRPHPTPVIRDFVFLIKPINGWTTLLGHGL